MRSDSRLGLVKFGSIPRQIPGLLRRVELHTGHAAIGAAFSTITSDLRHAPGHSPQGFSPSVGKHRADHHQRPNVPEHLGSGQAGISLTSSSVGRMSCSKLTVVLTSPEPLEQLPIARLALHALEARAKLLAPAASFLRARRLCVYAPTDGGSGCSLFR